MLFFYGCLLGYLCYGFIDGSVPTNAASAFVTLLFIPLGAFLTNLPFVLVVTALIALVPRTEPLTTFLLSRKGFGTVVCASLIIGFLISMIYSNVSHKPIFRLDL